MRILQKTNYNYSRGLYFAIDDRLCFFAATSINDMQSMFKISNKLRIKRSVYDEKYSQLHKRGSRQHHQYGTYY